MTFLTLSFALTLNGSAMIFWGVFLFARYDIVVAKIEGKKMAATKSKADIMIWRICGLWVMFSGFACLFVTDYYYFWFAAAVTTGHDDTMYYENCQLPLALLAVTMHTIEVGVKYQALGPSLATVWDGTRGNIVLASVLFVGLCFGS